MDQLPLDLGIPDLPPMREGQKRVHVRGARKITGTMRGRIKCGTRCRVATSDECNCSCGGLNHGIDLE